MKRAHIYGIVFLLIALFTSIDLSAHTINKELEQTYSETYFLLFFISSLLPFIGLGILAFNPQKKGATFQFSWPFFIFLTLGLIIGFILHDNFSTVLLNKIGLVLIGGLIIFIKDTNYKWINIVLIIFGVSLGIEYGQYFLHTESLMWFYALTFASGILLFTGLNNIRIIGNSKLQIPLNILSLFLILSGIILILLT
jgi:hypothetical protein